MAADLLEISRTCIAERLTRGRVGKFCRGRRSNRPRTLESAVDSDPLCIGVQLFKEGQLKDAVLQFARAIEQKETSERWNDWATAQLACGRPIEAEYGYRRALELDSENAQAAANLGVLLMGQGLTAEAVPFLERSAEGVDDLQRAKIEGLLAKCFQSRAPHWLPAPEGRGFRLPPVARGSPRLRPTDDIPGPESSAIEGSLAPAGSYPKKAFGVKHRASGPAPVTEGEAAATPSRCARDIVECLFVYRHLPLPLQGRVLEVGCKLGQMLLELSSLGFEVWSVGIQPLPAALLRGCYLQGDLKDKLFVADCFDVVIVCLASEHAGRKGCGLGPRELNSDQQTLQEIYRILKPNGRLILTSALRRHGVNDSQRLHDRASLRNLLSSAGFEIDVETYWKQVGDYWRPSSCEEDGNVDSVSEGLGALAGIVAHRTSSAEASIPVSASLG